MLPWREPEHDAYQTWSAQGVCHRLAGRDAWLLPGGSYLGDDTIKPEAADAKEACSYCPVLAQCRSQTLGELSGIWGGLDERERAQQRKARCQAWHMHATQADRLALGGYVARLRRQQLSWSEIVRRTALSSRIVHEAEEDYQRATAERQARTPRVPAHVWPARAPEGWDAWLHRLGAFYPAHYAAEDPSGEWLLMRYRYRSADTLLWARSANVQLRRSITPVYRHKGGRHQEPTGTEIPA